MKDLLFFSEAFAEMNRFHYNKGKSFAKKIGRRIMKKIDAHLHLVRDLASYKAMAEAMPWEMAWLSGTAALRPASFPLAGVMTLFEQTPPGK